MSVVALVSAGHSPGVTTTALGLTLEWPGEALLVDADPHPTQSVLAGFLGGEDPFGKGLWQVLSAYREHRQLPPAIEDAALALDASGERRQRFLPGFAHPGMADLFAPVWPDFVAMLADRAGDVLIDAGRLAPRGLPAALADGAEAVLMVTGSSLVELAALRLHLPLLTAAVPVDRLRIVVVGPDRPYSAREIAAQFAVETTDTVPWAPADAAVLSDGATRRRSFGSYLGSLRRLAVTLAEAKDSRRQLIGAPG